MKKAILLLLFAIPCTVWATDTPGVYLSHQTIVKDNKFTGTNIDLDINLNQDEDIVVLVQGPRRSYKIRKKEKMYGIWVNSTSYTIPFIPSYYYVATNKKASAGRFLAHNTTDLILANILNDASFIMDTQYTRIYGAFISKMQSLRLFPTHIDNITGSGKYNFHAGIPLPESAAVGEYQVYIYTIDGLKIINKEKLEFHVTKRSFASYMEQLAISYPLLNALFAIALALIAGFTAAKIFSVQH